MFSLSKTKKNSSLFLSKKKFEQIRLRHDPEPEVDPCLPQERPAVHPLPALQGRRPHHRAGQAPFLEAVARDLQVARLCDVRERVFFFSLVFFFFLPRR